MSTHWLLMEGSRENAVAEEVMDIMNEEGMLIMVAGYGDLASARHDFAVLNDKVRKGRFELREAVLVTKDADGAPKVIDAANHHGRAGAGWGAGMGFLVGLVAPPLIASVAVGAAAGMLIAKFADHCLKSGLRHEIGEALANGTGVVIAVLPEASRPSVEGELAGSSTRSVVAFGEPTIASLEREVAEAMSKVSPDSGTPTSTGA